MIKKIVIHTLLLIPLAGCASDPREIQCEEDKNYVIKNPTAIEKFLKEKEEGKIKGFYSYNADTPKCNYGDCMEFSKNFEYVERSMIFMEKKSIYTITRTYNLNNPECIEENWLKIKRKKNYCYIVKENNNGEIKSEYEYEYDGKGIQKISMKNNKTGEILFKMEYQIYSVKYLGATGGGWCPSKKDNHPEYNINLLSLIN